MSAYDCDMTIEAAMESLRNILNDADRAAGLELSSLCHKSLRHNKPPQKIEID
jgi:hypothetical protein